MNKNSLLKKFEEVYKDCELFAIQLNGFSHTIFYKDKEGYKHVDGYSACSPEQVRERTLYDDGVYRSFNSQQSKQLLGSFPHYCYQGNAEELVFLPISQW